VTTLASNTFLTSITFLPMVTFGSDPAPIADLRFFCPTLLLTLSEVPSPSHAFTAAAIRRKSQPDWRSKRISGTFALTSLPVRAAGSEQPLEVGFSMSRLRAHRPQCSARRAW